MNATRPHEAPHPADALALEAPSPPWFDDACGYPVQSRRTVADGCAIHYLLWRRRDAAAGAPGLLLVHGGGAHANWWRFIAPFFTDHHDVAAMDLSGMGDSGWRESYSATVRAGEIDAVLAAAGFLDAGRAPPIVVGHSFGGLTAMRHASLREAGLGGLVLAEAPVRPPHVSRPAAMPPVNASRVRLYDDFAAALARFRLKPAQSCEHAFIVEHIARHSLKRVAQGWTWKFDPAALTTERHAEPFGEYLAASTCRAALVFGEKSALATPAIAEHMLRLLDRPTPLVNIPEAQHHLMLDQPLAFVSAVRAILAGWRAADLSGESKGVAQHARDSPA